MVERAHWQKLPACLAVPVRKSESPFVMMVGATQGWLLVAGLAPLNRVCSFDFDRVIILI